MVVTAKSLVYIHISTTHKEILTMEITYLKSRNKEALDEGRAITQLLKDGWIPVGAPFNTSEDDYWTIKLIKPNADDLRSQSKLLATEGVENLGDESTLRRLNTVLSMVLEHGTEIDISTHSRLTRMETLFKMTQEATQAIIVRNL